MACPTFGYLRLCQMALIIFYFQMMSCAGAGREAVSGRQQATSQAAGGQTGARWPDSVEKVTAVRTERESSS